MGKASGIQWTNHTFNPWWGCEKVSPGCKHCYAETFAARPIHVLPGGGKGALPIWGGASTVRRFFGDGHWRDPVAWNRAAEKAKTRARVFCASMADVFEDRKDLDPYRARLFELIEATPWLDWQLLTKRPQNMVRLAPDRWRDGWPVNVWAGCTVENQEEAERRIPHLILVPARVHFLSMEPLVSAVDLGFSVASPNPVCVADERCPAIACVDWIIVGGESGKCARPFDLAWARSLIRQADAAGVAMFLKQLGSNPHQDVLSARAFGSLAGVRDYHGGEENEWPLDLHGRRAFPKEPQ